MHTFILRERTFGFSVRGLTLTLKRALEQSENISSPLTIPSMVSAFVTSSLEETPLYAINLVTHHLKNLFDKKIHFFFFSKLAIKQSVLECKQFLRSAFTIMVIKCYVPFTVGE